MSEVKWIQITTDVFDNWKVKHIKAIPEVGHSLVCLWFELLCMAGSINDSGVIFLNNFVATDEIIAETFNEDIKLVKMALQMFESLGMISIIDNNAIQIANWDEYQNEGGLAKIREYERKRKEKYRSEKTPLIDKKTCPGNVPDKSMDSSLSISISNIINYLNKTINSNYKSSTEETRKHIRARLKEGFTEEDFYLVIDSKARAWKDDAKMCEYLRPKTLFGTKFEGYLNTAKNEVWNSDLFNYDDSFDALFKKYGLKGNETESKQEYLNIMKGSDDPKKDSWWLFEAINLYTAENEHQFRKEFQVWLKGYSKQWVVKAKEKIGE